MSSKKQGYMVGSPTQVHATMQLMSTVLASMRAVSWLHWTSHWQVRGGYGDHLMFAKFYELLIEEIDTLAEKCVGYFGAPAVDPFKQMAKTQECMERFKKFDCLHERSLAAEEDLQVTLRSAYKVLKDINAMTLGLDDYLMSIANAHESNIYLLQQRIGKEDGRPGIEKPPFDFTLVGDTSPVQKKASEKEAFFGPFKKNPADYVEVIRKSDGKKVKIKKTTLHGTHGSDYKHVNKEDHHKHERERLEHHIPKLVKEHKDAVKENINAVQYYANRGSLGKAEKHVDRHDHHQNMLRKLHTEHKSLSEKHKDLAKKVGNPFDEKKTDEKKTEKKTDKKAFNKYNAPELIAQLFAVLRKFDLDDTVDELKSKRIPQLVNDAWRKRDKRGSEDSMENTWFSAAYLYSTDEENEDG